MSHTQPGLRLSSSLLTPTNLARAMGLLFGVLTVSEGLLSIYNPALQARSFGIPITESPNPDPSDPTSTSPVASTTSSSAASTWVALAGARAMGYGCCIFGLGWRGEWRAMGLLLLCGIPTGIVDSVIVWREGAESRGKAWGHVIGTGLLLVSGEGLLGWM